MGLLPVSVLLLAAVPLALAGGAPGQQREDALLQTWGEELDGNLVAVATDAKDTPVTRVVNLLKDMQTTLKKEMDEDAALYDKLACWCNTNENEKGNAISEQSAKVTELTSTIEALTAKSAELTATIKQLEEDTAAGKQALATATALREKEAITFRGQETESMANIKNLEAAITVLAKHHGGALPQMPGASQESVSFLSMRGGNKKATRAKKSHTLSPWDSDHESRLTRSFDEFMEQNGFDDSAAVAAAAAVDVPTAQPAAVAKTNLMQDQEQAKADGAADGAGASATWTAEETAILQRAMKSAKAFMQARQGEEYYPSYSARSGQIMGMLKELKDQMTANLGEAQKTEMERQTAFNDLRSSKMAEIQAAEKQAEEKEDQLAKANMDLAESKEDLGQTEAVLAESQQFMANLKATCQDADKNFEERKSARLSEIKAVAETIAILTADEARDVMSSTYSFAQLASRRSSGSARKQAAAVIRGVAVKNPELAILATRVELDSFERVKKAIDDMVSMLKVQQDDEVKKQDWCNSEIHQNEVATAKTEDTKASLSLKADDLAGDISRLSDDIQNAQAQISQLHLDLQRATENRQKENLEFQKTIADQRATQAVLKTALERLAKYYDEEGLLQTKSKQRGGLLQTKSKSKAKGSQTPPVPQMEYKKSAGAEGVMQMIEKLIHEAKDLEAYAIKGESAAQAQYETLVADTNASVSGLMKDIASKTGMRAQASKEKSETEGDLKDTVGELEDLGQTGADLHAECDYLIKNFGVRQEARSQEIEALQQAKQILSGASLN